MKFVFNENISGSNNGIDIIDYKFGEEHKSQYEKQVKNYMNLLENMGYNNIRGFIWYIEKNKIKAKKSTIK